MMAPLPVNRIIVELSAFKTVSLRSLEFSTSISIGILNINTLIYTDFINIDELLPSAFSELFSEFRSVEENVVKAFVREENVETCAKHSFRLEWTKFQVELF